MKIETHKEAFDEYLAHIEQARALAYGSLKKIKPDNLLKNISLLFELKDLVEEVCHEKL